jgi:hypothetical protein
LAGNISKDGIVIPTIRASFIVKDPNNPSSSIAITEKNILDSSKLPYESDRSEHTYFEEGTFDIVYEPDPAQLSININIGHLNQDILVGDSYICAKLKNKIDFSVFDNTKQYTSLENFLIENDHLTFQTRTTWQKLKGSSLAPDEDYIYSPHQKVTEGLESTAMDNAVRALQLDTRKGIVCFDDTNPLTMQKDDNGSVYLEPETDMNKCYTYKNGTFFDTALTSKFEPTHELILDDPNSYIINNTISKEQVGSCGGGKLLEPERFPQPVSDDYPEHIYTIEFQYIEYDTNKKFYYRKAAEKFSFPFILAQNPEEIKFDTSEEFSLYLKNNANQLLIQRLIIRFGLVKENHTYEVAPSSGISVTRIKGPKRPYLQNEDVTLPCASKIDQRILELRPRIAAFEHDYEEIYVQPFVNYRNYLYREQVLDTDKGETTTFISRLQRRPFIWCNINLGAIVGEYVTAQEAKFNIKMYGYAPAKTAGNTRFQNDRKPGFVYHGIVEKTLIDGKKIEENRNVFIKNKPNNYPSIDGNISIHEVVATLRSKNFVSKDKKEGLPSNVLQFIKQLKTGTQYLRSEDVSGMIDLPKTIQGLNEYRKNKQELDHLLDILKDSKKYRSRCGDGELGVG